MLCAFFSSEAPKGLRVDKKSEGSTAWSTREVGLIDFYRCGQRCKMDDPCDLRSVLSSPLPPISRSAHLPSSFQPDARCCLSLAVLELQRLVRCCRRWRWRHRNQRRHPSCCPGQNSDKLATQSSPSAWASQSALR